MMTSVNLDDDDQQLLRIIAEFYINHGADRDMHSPSLSIKDLAGETGLDGKRIQQKLARFESYGLLEVNYLARGLDMQYVIAEQDILAVIEELDRKPPPRDLWREINTWARSKPWFVAVLLFSIAIPWMVGIVSGLKTLLDWCGISK